MRALLVIILACTTGGCLVVDDTHLKQVLAGNLDGGESDEDSGASRDAGFDAGNAEDAIPVMDRCGGSSEFVLFDTMGGRVDTNGLSNRVGSCGSRGAPGNDAFIAIDVRGGDLWHFHIMPDPTVADQVRDPFVYLLDSRCQSTACDHFSDACRGPGDEHFAFVAPSDGTWYLGIDDGNPGGGIYQLEAYKLNCGDNMVVHGEACDGTQNCSSDCREIIGQGRPSEQLPNDNAIEANYLDLPASRDIVISGTIGGDSCVYPDVYTFENVQDGSNLVVEVQKTDGTVCDNPSLTPFDIVLRNSRGEVAAGPQTNASTGCAELRASGLPAQRFFLYVEHDEPLEDRPLPYRLHIRLTT